MIDNKSLESMTEDIQSMRSIAEHLRETGKEIVTVERNITRILSSIRLLEMNVTDVAKIT
jgi:hypothetical protein